MEYNYQVIFKGKQSEGSAKFMTEKMARTFATHILQGSKLLDLVVQVKRLTPDPRSSFSFAGTTDYTGTLPFTNPDSITWTDNYNPDEV